MLRIVAGEWRGFRIHAPPGRKTRPTSERVREAIFDVLAHSAPLEDLAVYDLYAGSGALGIEALSRGAPHATFVEADGRNAAGIRANLERVGAPPARWAVVTARVEPWLRRSVLLAQGQLLLLDPPYASGEAARVLGFLAASATVAPGTLIVVESAAQAEPELPAGLELWQAKRYGDTRVWFLLKLGSPREEQ